MNRWLVSCSPRGRRIRVATAPERYAVRFDGAADLTLDGQGSTFLLGPDVRFLRLRGSRQTTIRRLQVDFDPLPFADGTVAAANAEGRYLDVAVGGREADRLQGGPTRHDGEQAFFAMLWHPGAYGPSATALASDHGAAQDHPLSRAQRLQRGEPG